MMAISLQYSGGHSNYHLLEDSNTLTIILSRMVAMLLLGDMVFENFQASGIFQEFFKPQPIVLYGSEKCCMQNHQGVTQEKLKIWWITVQKWYQSHKYSCFS
jgi:hypothetical protein